MNLKLQVPTLGSFIICLLFGASLALPASAQPPCMLSGKVVINEFVAANSNTLADEFGEFDDWVEIYNASDEPQFIGGYFLSDNHGDRSKYTFPAITLQPGDFYIVWCDNQPEQGENHAAFGLSADGEELGLYNTDTTALDYVKFGEMPSNIAMGKFPNGTGPVRTLIPTPNAPNTNSVPIGLVINEFMAINESTAQDQWGGFEDWIELYNNSSQPLNLNGYFLSDRVGDPTQFTFPDTVMDPFSYLIVWCDMGLLEPGLHTIFQLGGDGDDILLSNADTITLDYFRYGLQTPDESVQRFPNGSGAFVCGNDTYNESNGGTIGVQNRQREALNVYPNPATDFVWLENLTSSGEVQIFSPRGELVIRQAVYPGNNRVEVNNLQRGIYLLRLETKTAKLVVN